MPGRWALKVCPDLLSVLASQVKTVAVTGTNGKTTSCRIIEEAFMESGKTALTNRSGANLMGGIVTTFAMNSSLSGKMRKQYAVIECDEAASVRVFEQLKPQVIVVTNLFRDQLDRYGEVTHVLDALRRAISKVPEATLCLNADCSLTASIADDMPNRVAWFGMEKGACVSREKPLISDAEYCIRCKTEYEYDYRSYAHLGGFRCPRCGFHRHTAQYAITRIVETSLDSTLAEMQLNVEKRLVRVNLPAKYNLYNAIGAAAAVMEMGVDTDNAVAALSAFKCGFGRMENINFSDTTAKMILVKNPVGCNETLAFLKETDNNFVLVLCLNDNEADGKDISWIWDTDFESLASISDRIERIIVSGNRAADMCIRLKYAGIPEKRMEIEHSYTKLIKELENEKRLIYVLPNYTAMLELRGEIAKQSGGQSFWNT